MTNFKAAGRIPGGFLKSQPDGFLSHRTAVDYGQADTLYGWTRSASNSLILDRAIPNPAYVTFGCQYALPPISGALVQCWEADAGTWLQYYDESMRPSSTRNQIPDGGTLAAIDERGMVIGMRSGEEPGDRTASCLSYRRQNCASLFCRVTR